MWWLLLLLPGAGILACYMRWRTLATRARWRHEHAARYARWAREDGEDSEAGDDSEDGESDTARTTPG